MLPSLFLRHVSQMSERPDVHVTTIVVTPRRYTYLMEVISGNINFFGENEPKLKLLRARAEYVKCLNMTKHKARTAFVFLRILYCVFGGMPGTCDN